MSKPFSRAMVAALASLLVLAGCGDKDQSAQSSNSAPDPGDVKAVAAPTGTRWSETVAATPGGGFVMGNPAAPLKLIEYASFTCPHCRDFAAASDAPLRARVDTGKLSFEFRNLIRDPMDITAAMIARCGGKDPFFALAHQLYDNQDAMFATVQKAGGPALEAAMQLAPDKRFVRVGEITGMIDFAKTRGIPEAQARTCLADFKTAERLAAGNDVATKQYNVEGTPTLILNEQKLDNVATWPTLEAALKKAGA